MVDGDQASGERTVPLLHMRAIMSEMRRVHGARKDELASLAKEFNAPLEMIEFVHKNGTLPVPNFSAGGIATPADAALMMQLGAESVFVGSGIFKAAASLSPEERIKSQSRRAKAIVEAVYKNDIDIITHPGLQVSIDTVELAKACAKTDTALEINVKHGVKSVGFIQAAAHEGVKFAIGSDAHSPDRIGKLEAGVRAAQEAGLRAEQIINVYQD